MVERTYFTTLDIALGDTLSACEAATDTIDYLCPQSWQGQVRAAVWLARQIETLTQDAVACGAPARLAEAGSGFADAIVGPCETLPPDGPAGTLCLPLTWRAIREAQERLNEIVSLARLCQEPPKTVAPAG